MSEKKEKKEKKKKEKKEKKGKNDSKDEDGKTKIEGKEKKARERKSRVSFLHERQTVPPPPRCAVGEEMRVEGTQLAAELVAAKMEGKGTWPPPNLLTKCLKSRSVLDRNEEHRLEEIRRAKSVLQSKKATEDARAAVLAAQEGVKNAERLLMEYRAKLKEDRIKEVAAKRLAARAAKEAEATAAAAEAAQEAEAAVSGKRPKKDKEKKDENDKKEDKKGKKEDKKEKKDKGKGKKGKGKVEESELAPEILLSPRENWKLLEEGIAKAKDAVFEAEVQVEVYLDHEAQVEATLNDPFSTGHVYCMLGMDSALPIAELCAEKTSFFRGVLNLSLRPKVPLILPESSGPSTPRDDDAASVTSTSSISSSKSVDSKKRRKSRKEAKAAAKAAKVEAAVSAVPLLVSEIRSLKERCILTDPLRKVAVLDVFYEPAPPPELDFFSELPPKDEDTKHKKEMIEEGSEREKEPKEKRKREKKEKKKKKKKKGDTEERTEEGIEKKEKKRKKSKEGRRGSKKGDSALPYKEIAQAVIAACQRLQIQVEVFNQMGGDTCRVFTVPAAKPLEEVDISYYSRLINDVPQGLVSVPIIVHCLVEQVSAYSWPVEDIKTLEVAKENKRLLRGMEEAFRKLGHPKWIGVDRDTSSNLAKRFEMLYNFSQEDAAQSLIPYPSDQSQSKIEEKDYGSMLTVSEETGSLNKGEVISKNEGFPTKVGNSAVKSSRSGSAAKAETGVKKSRQGDPEDYNNRVADLNFRPEDEKESEVTSSGDMQVSATCGDCMMHEAISGTCAVHHDHVDMGDEVQLRKPETPESPYDPFAKPKDLEERLNVTHEFDTVMRMLLTSESHKPQFTDSVDVVKVGEHLSKIRATPGRGRRKMPVKPEHSEEKMGASLTALQDLCEKYEEPRFAISDEDAIFHCAEHLAAHPPSPAVPVQTLQRYKKLTTFFEMVKEDKLILPDLDIPVEEPPKEQNPAPPAELVDPPDLTPDQMKDWCEVCRRIFSEPAMRAKVPKLIPSPAERLSIRHRMSVLERKKSLVEIIQEKKKSLSLDQDMFGLEMTMSVGLTDKPEPKPEEQELRTDSFYLEVLEHAERHYDTDPGLDPEVVQTWCPVCARIFAVPTPPDLQVIWEEGERMRLEMEQLAREKEQAIIAAKVAAWEQKKERVRESIIDRRHAEGFADGLMGEVYARAKLHLPFEILGYDRDEDCVLAILYAADGERMFTEEIPVYVPFGEFCLEDVSKVGPIKRRREAYELETPFRSIHDKRRYLLTEDGGLVVCGLPAMSHIQYEPRTTVFKDGIIVTLRAPEMSCEEKPEKKQEQPKVDDGPPPREVEEAAKSKNKKGGSRDPSPNPNKGDKKESPSDDHVKPGKEGKKKEKSKKKKGEEQDAKATTGSAPDGTEAMSSTAGPVPDAVYTSGHSSSEKQRTVMAFLVDGVIVCFFFAKDGTLSLQVNNPSGRTFELTSSGVVAFLPVGSHEDQPPSTSAASTPPYDLSSAGPLPPVEEEVKEGKSKKKGKGTPERSSSPEKEKEKGGRTRKKGGTAEGSPRKDGDKEEKEKKKKKGDSKDEESGKETEKGKKSKKKKGEKEVDIPEAGTDVEQIAQSAVTSRPTAHLTSDLQFLSKVYDENQGEKEISRCILPTGSVISYKQDGQIQILLNDGNVSEYTAIPNKAAVGKTTGEEKTTSGKGSLEKAKELTLGWHTTNNRGLSAIKLPVPKFDPLKMKSRTSGDGEEENFLDKKKERDSKGKVKKSKDKKEGKEKEEGADKEEGQTDGREIGKKKASKEKATKGETQDTVGPQKTTKYTASDEETNSGVLASTPEVPTPGASPADALSHVEMPSMKVIEIRDPDTGSSILTREDLVVVVRTDDQSVRVVQHADGTHIYSEIRDVTPSEYKPSVGQQMIDDIKKFNAHATLATLCTTSSRKVPGLTAKEADNIQLLAGTIERPNLPLHGGSQADCPPPNIEMTKDAKAKLEVKTAPLSTPAPEYLSVNRDMKPVAGTQFDIVGDSKLFEIAGTMPHAAEADKSRVLCTAQWHVRKDGFPNVQGNTRGGVAVEFSTVEGQYCATWSKESGQLSLLMPSGSMLYSCGKLVHFDPSDGTKKADPKQKIHDQLIKGRPFINTNGMYEFNLEQASLSFTDNSGNGFRTSWGFKVDPITAGKLPEPPSQAIIGTGIEGPVEFDKPSESLNFTPKDVPLTEETKEVSPKTSSGEAGSKAKVAGHKVDPMFKAAATKNGPAFRAPLSKKTSKVHPLKGDQKGDASKASKSQVPDSEASEVVDEFHFRPAEKQDLEADSLASIPDPGPASDISTASRPASVHGSEDGVPEEPYLGPYPRLFVIHEGGFGFEILHEDDFEKYAYSKVFKKECTRVMENYAKSDVMLHTFVTVEQKRKKLAELDVEKHEGCKAPDGLKLWTKKVPEFASRIKLRTVLSKMQKRTKCDWLQLNLELPFLPRAVTPEMLPVMPLSKVTNIMFRQIFEYASFGRGRIRKMDKILEIYKEWQDSSMILRDIEVIPDERTPQDKKKAEDIAQRIREGVAEQKLQEARERAAIEVQHAAQIFGMLREKELESQEEFERLKRNVQAESLKQWHLYKESKKGRIPCRHKVYHLFQKKPPFRPAPNWALLYFHCEEGLEFIYRLNFYRRPPPGPRRWSVETTPPRSEQGLDVFSQQESGLGSDVGRDAHDFPDRQPPKEETVREPVKPEICIVEEWVKEEPKPTGVAEKGAPEKVWLVEEVKEFPETISQHRSKLSYILRQRKIHLKKELLQGIKLCWEEEPPKKPKRETAPADWTPCFMEGFDMGSAFKPEPEEAEEVKEPEEAEKDPFGDYLFAGDENDEYYYESAGDLQDGLVNGTYKPEPKWEPETEPSAPQLQLPPFWQAPTGIDWQINSEAVQYQLELLPIRPGWVKAEWRENTEYLDLNLPTMLNMQISSVAQLKLREKPPVDWAHQFLLVPQHLDYGTVEYGTISMKVAFLQNYHGTNCGRFRFEDLGPCCRILCEYGMVPPGLHRALRVFFRADRVGKFEHQIKVLTQYDIFTFPIYANVVRPKAHDVSQKKESPGSLNPEYETVSLHDSENV